MRWSKHKISVFFLVLLLLSLSLASKTANPQSFTGKVVGISDGDTIKVMREGKAVKVRLHGIDCPERKQPYGTRAKRFTSDRAFRNEVTVNVKDTDRYGRIVGEVILPGGSSLNKELVFVGLAWWYRKYAPNDRPLKALEAGARVGQKRRVYGGTRIPYRIGNGGKCNVGAPRGEEIEVEQNKIVTSLGGKFMRSQEYELGDRHFLLIH